MKIACVLGQGFEDSEYNDPFQAYQEAGHQVTVVGVQGGQELKGKGGKVTTRSEKAVADCRPEDFDALFIPGGYSPDHIRVEPRMVAFAKSFMDADKPVFAICHGPQLLMASESVRGRRMTAWTTIQHDLKLAGADVVDEPVVVDRNLVTSRKPDDIPQFNQASLQLLGAAVGSR